MSKATKRIVNVKGIIGAFVMLNRPFGLLKSNPNKLNSFETRSCRRLILSKKFTVVMKI